MNGQGKKPRPLGRGAITNPAPKPKRKRRSAATPRMSDIKQRVLAAAAAQEAELAALADTTEGEVEYELAGIYLPGETPQYIKRTFSKSGKLMREEVTGDYQ